MIGTFAVLLYANHFLKKQILFGQEKKNMFYLYFSLFNKNIHEVKNIAIRIVSCHTYRDTYRIVKMCIVTSLVITSLGINAFSWTVFLASSSIQRRAALQQRSLYWQAYKLLCDIFLLIVKTFFCGGKHISAGKVLSLE